MSEKHRAFHEKSQIVLSEMIKRLDEVNEEENKGLVGSMMIDMWSAAYEKHKRDNGSYKYLMTMGMWEQYDKKMNDRLWYQLKQVIRYVENDEPADVIFEELKS